MRILIAGCGFLGAELARQLTADGHSVWGLRRNLDALPDGIAGIAANLHQPLPSTILPDRLDAAVFAATSDGSDPTAYRATYVAGQRNLLDCLTSGGHRLRRYVFVSSTGVYGQLDGSWVDETSPAEPRQETGRILLEAEQLALTSAFPSTVVRFGGLYGPRRNRLIERVRSGEATISAGDPVYTNRIHRDDAAGAIRHLLTGDDAATLYLGVDDEPADESIVLRWLATHLGVPPPRIADSPTLNRRNNKRCRNARLRAAGFEFRFPTFREGYEDVIRRLATSQPEMQNKPG